MRYTSTRYTILEGKLYRREFNQPLLKWVDKEERVCVRREIHEGIYSTHCVGQSLAYKISRLGYYWPTLKKDAMEYTKKCDLRQMYLDVPHAPPEPLSVSLSPLPLAIWEMDLMGKLPTTREGNCYAVVHVNYFTKWAKTAPLTKITERILKDFLYTKIICRFGIPNLLIADNRTQFEA